MLSFEDIVLDIEQKNKQYDKICEMLQFEEVLQDNKFFMHLNKKKLLLDPLIENYKNFQYTLKNIQELQDIIFIEKNKDDFIKELNEEKQKKELLQQQLIKLYNSLEKNTDNLSIEIIKNNNDLSNKLVDMLLQGYTNFLKNNFCEFNITQENNNTLLVVKGENIKQYFEMQRATHILKNKQEEGLCYVYVYNNFYSEKYFFKDNELEISVCRSSGAGGQHINKTESAVKILHKPTGLVGISQDERSQFQNKQKALERLKQKVENYLESEKAKNLSFQKKEQLNLVKTTNIVYNLNTHLIILNKKQINLEDFLNGKNLII